jgi:VWFA-related protein
MVACAHGKATGRSPPNKMRTLITALAAISVLAAGTGRAQDAPQTTPSFRSGVEALPIDVTVVNDRGEPIRDLIVPDFNVRIDGRPRKVVSAQWIAAAGTGGGRAAAPSVPEGYVSNESSVGGRLIVLVVDQPNISFGDMRPLRGALEGFIDRLSSGDRVAVIGLGQPSVSTPFIADKAQLKQAVARIPGHRQSPGGGSHEVPPTAALAIDLGDEGALEQVAARDCPGLTPRQRLACKEEIRAEALQIASETRQSGDLAIRGLREVLTSLKAVEAPKTVLFFSQGFYADRERGDDIGRITELGGLAAAARARIYSLRMEDSIDLSRQKTPQSQMNAEDQLIRRYGLETLTGAAGGALFSLAGTGAAVFDRIGSELSGSYLLGVEPDARDRDGKPHPVRVDVSRAGTTVRAHRTLLAGTETSTGGPRTPREAATAALSSPLPASSLPIRAIAFAFRGLEPSKVRLLVHAEIGTNYTAPQRLSIAYYVLDKDGKSVDGQVSDVRIAPTPGVPSPLVFSGGASVDPGEYVVKLAVADGERVGSVDMPVRASLLDLGRVKLTELIAGGPIPPVNLLRPSVGTRVSFGTLHGYLEAYGPDAATLGVRFEVAADERGPAILGADVQGVLVGEERVMFSQMMLVQSLPPGSYRMRAMVRQGDTLVTSLGRAFEIAAPATLAAASPNAPVASAPGGAPLYLPVEQRDLARAFARDDALKPAVLQPFQERVAPGVRAAFDEGITHLQRREYKEAEASFKRAIQPDADSTGSLAYLGVTYAAAGRDSQAASVWRTAMADGDDIPQLYEWLGDALMRLKSTGEARPILEEAATRWPADLRFARPLALIYATFGKGVDAVRLLEKFLQDRADDQASLFLMLEWMFSAHRGGQLVHDRAEDVRLAHAYAEQYVKAGGLNEPLVKQWLSYFDKEAR